MIKQVSESIEQVLRVAKSAVEETIAGSLVVVDSLSDVSGVAHATCRVLQLTEEPHARDRCDMYRSRLRVQRSIAFV